MDKDNEYITDNLQSYLPSENRAIYEKLADASAVGFEVEFDPSEAELAGAFPEDAMSEEDAYDSSIDAVST